MPCRFSSGPAESVGKLYTFTGGNNYVQLNQRLARVAQKLLLIAYSNFSRDLSMKRLLAAAIATFSCLTAFAGAITLTGTVRDFNADGVNFEGSLTSGPGYVGSILSGASPTLTALGSSVISNTGAGAFSNWYTNVANSTPYSLTLNETSPGSGVYQYTNTNFYPIDGALLGNQGRAHNYHFTYAIASTFSYIQGAGQTFAFTGDDDVWVYFDKQLGIDLGGVHGALSQTVNLDTLMAGKTSGDYSFDFFFAERHTTQSNLLITTSLVLRDPPNAVPEPGSIALIGLSLVGLAVARRRKSA